MRKKAKQTLDDIALLANVSKSTVSRALNNSPLINPATRERIQSIARSQNFRINTAGRNLRLRNSRTIAFVTPDCYPDFFSPEDFFGLGVLGGIGNELHRLGYDLLVINVSVHDNSWVNDYLDSGRVDGFILIDSNHKLINLKYLVEVGAPFIVWGTPIPQFNYCSITGDNINGGMLATKHLIGIGRKRIAFLGGPEKDVSVQNRFRGYEIALSNYGRQIKPNLITYGNYSYSSGKEAMDFLIQNNPDMDAVFVNSDLMAISAIQTIHRCGRRVPEDIAVIGYDDLPIAEYNTLPLTTIRQNIPMAGQLLAHNLIQYIQTGIVTNVTTPVELILRQTA